MTDWTARRIVKELADAERRRTILADFWRFEDAEGRLAAQAYLAKKLHFRDQSVKKLPPERKAELLAARINDPECEHFLGMALMQYHLHRARPLMAAFLDRWQVPHDDGLVSEGGTPPPLDVEKVRAAVNELAGAFDPADVRLYLATAGLLMGDEWRDAMWPVVDELAPAG
jgi:hypothetical protein